MTDRELTDKELRLECLKLAFDLDDCPEDNTCHKICFYIASAKRFFEFVADVDNDDAAENEKKAEDIGNFTVKEYEVLLNVLEEMRNKNSKKAKK